MKVKDVCVGWVRLLIDGNTSVRGRLTCGSCNANGYYFMSYNTPIAKYIGGKFQLATKKYSPTTSKQQNYLRMAIPDSMLEEVEEIKDNGEFPWRR